MKKLDEIKDEYARGRGYSHWIDFLRDTGAWSIDTAMYEIAKRYAREAEKNYEISYHNKADFAQCPKCLHIGSVEEFVNEFDK